MTPELLHAHVEHFNRGVRSGDFAPMLEYFADDAELVFEGVPVGPFHGKEAIAQAYRTQPPDDEVDVLDSRIEGDEIVAAYSWRADDGRRAGEMILTPAGDRIARLVITFERR